MDDTFSTLVQLTNANAASADRISKVFFMGFEISNFGQGTKKVPCNHDFFGIIVSFHSSFRKSGNFRKNKKGIYYSATQRT